MLKAFSWLSPRQLSFHEAFLKARLTAATPLGVEVWDLRSKSPPCLLAQKYECAVGEAQSVMAGPCGYYKNVTSQLLLNHYAVDLCWCWKHNLQINIFISHNGMLTSIKSDITHINYNYIAVANSGILVEKQYGLTIIKFKITTLFIPQGAIILGQWASHHIH